MDLIFSIILLVGSIFLFIMAGTQAPPGTPTELGAAFWPQLILGITIILLIVQILRQVKAFRASGKGLTEGINIGGFFKSRLFVGMLVVAGMAILLPVIGFIPACAIFLVVYGILLKAENIKMLAIVSLLATAFIYVLFQGALDIMLPRGILFFRDFSLFFEMLLPF